MLRPRIRSGRIITFFLSLIRRYEWLLLAFILWILNKLINIPLFYTYIALGLWVLSALIFTLIIVWANRSASYSMRTRENLNPYSAKNKDYLPEKDNK